MGELRGNPCPAAGETRGRAWSEMGRAPGLKQIAWSIRLYFLLMGSRVRSQMEYRSSFVVTSISNFVATFLDFVNILIIFGHIKALAGWDVGEVALLYGLTSISFALAEAFGSGFERFNRFVRLGQFDTMLVRPVSSFMQVLTNDFQMKRIGRLAQGFMVFFGAIYFKHLSFEPWQWLVLGGAVISGMLVFTAIFLAQAATCFWTIESMEAFNLLTYGGTDMLSRPMEVYADYLRRFFIFVIPLAFTCYFPARLVLGKGSDVIAAPPWTGWIAPVVGLAAFAVGKLIWEFGVRHYQSTGS